VGGGDVGVPFYRVGGGAGRPGDGGEHVAVVVCHDGGGGGRFGRGSFGVVVGIDEGGGCSDRFRSEGRRARSHEAAVAASAVQPREEDDRVRPTCRRERVTRAGWAGQRLRPSGGW
jgi:hypothetical protein